MGGDGGQHAGRGDGVQAAAICHLLPLVTASRLLLSQYRPATTDRQPTVATRPPPACHHQGWICRLPGARVNITVCDVAPRPGLNPSGLVNNSSLTAGPQFTEIKFCKLTANVPAHYDTDFVYMRVYYG